MASGAWRSKPALAHMQNPFRGNWFKKKIIVQDARSLYSAIHTLVTEHWEPEFQAFLHVYEPAVDMIRKRLTELEFASERISEVEHELQMQPQGMSSEVIALLQEAQGCFGIIRDVQANVEASIAVAREQLAMGDQYEKKAHQQYLLIDEAYDDLEASRLYDGMRAAQEHLVRLLGEYLQRQLVPYTQQLLQQFEASMVSLGKIKQDLKQFDIYLIERERPAPAAEPEPIASIKPGGWLSWAWAACVSAWNSIFGSIGALGSWLLSLLKAVV